MSETNRRFVAIDVHKRYVMVGAVNGEQDVVLHPHRVSIDELGEWAAAHLQPKDAVVLEASTNVWPIHDLLEPLAAHIVVVHPNHVKIIAASSVKTDKRDTLALARLLAANLLSSVWVPPIHVRELRGLVNHRKQLVRQRIAAKNRLHSVLHAYNIARPDGDPFVETKRDWWESLPLSGSVKLRVGHDLALIDYLSTLIGEADAELARLSVSEPWADQVPFLIQLSGIGLITAMTILSAIGDIRRFPTAKKLAGYSGLGTRVHASGQTHYTGRITKEGRRELRTVMVEAAWAAVRHHAHWKAQFEALAARIGKQRAIVAIARKLLVVVWHVLTNHTADRHAQPDAVVRKLLLWGTRHRLATSLGMSRRLFVLHHLRQLGFSQEMAQAYA
jgi:transposase